MVGMSRYFFLTRYKFLSNIKIAQSFSKYCIGMALTRDPSLRVNRFKKNLLNLNKIEQQRVSL